MNILVITPRFDEKSGGDGLYAYNLSVELRRKGQNVFVLSIEQGTFYLETLSAGQQEGEAGNILRLTDVGRNFFSQNFYSADAAAGLRTAIAASRPDIIHIHGLHQYFTVATVEELRKTPVPKIITVHDYKILCGNSGFFSDRTNDVCLKCLQGGYLYPITERCKRNSFVQSFGAAVQMGMWSWSNGLDMIDCFHCGSDFVRALLSRNADLQQRCVKLRMPFLTSRDSGSNVRRQPSGIRIVFIGRLVPHKGVSIFSRAIQGISDYPVEVFGDGPLLPEISAACARLPNVTLHGWQTHEKISEYLQPGSIVVLPYLAHETFCYAALEAMLHGCCVVTSDRGAIPELVRHNHNGIVVSELSPQGFHDAITALLDVPDRIYELGGRATTIAEELDSLDVHATGMLEIYGELIERSRMKRPQ